MADWNEFRVVRRKRSKKVWQQTQHSISLSETKDENESFDLQSFIQRLNKCIQEICTSQFFTCSYESIFASLSLLIQEKTKFGYKERSADTCNQTSDCKNNTSQPTENLQTFAQSYPDTNVHDDSTTKLLESMSLTQSEQPDIHILSYGIGNFTSSICARYQLAYLLALRDRLGDRCTECCIYDPAFSSQEKLLLQMYGCQVIAVNEEGKRVCHAPTVAFLPHCGRALYNNLLWRNLATEGSEGLSRLVLIGNSFSSVLERTPSAVLSKTGNYIMKLSPYITETPLANTFELKDVFNDMAIHCFKRSQVIAARYMIGHHFEEPLYEGDDAEFIRK